MSFNKRQRKPKGQ